MEEELRNLKCGSHHFSITPFLDDSPDSSLNMRPPLRLVNYPSGKLYSKSSTFTHGGGAGTQILLLFPLEEARVGRERSICSADDVH